MLFALNGSAPFNSAYRVLPPIKYLFDLIWKSFTLPPLPAMLYFNLRYPVSRSK